MPTLANSATSHYVSNQHGLKVRVLSDPAEADLEDLEACDALILDFPHHDACSSFLRRLRSSAKPSLYLKPAFLLSLTAREEDPGFRLADGILQTTDLNLILPVILQIGRRFKQLNSEPATPESNFRPEKLLRYLFTRDADLVPEIDPGSPFGYWYPILISESSRSNARDVVETIELALEGGYLTSEFQDRVHLCPHCLYGFLNFRETCPDCGAANLATEDVIHHFVCAYIGPESDYFRNGELQCPKCDRPLKHIGVDYDKPSQVYTCNTCEAFFQEPQMKVFCFHCKNESEPDRLKAFNVGKLQLTEKGRNAAIQGVSSSISVNSLPHGLVPFEIFGLFLQHETDRQQIFPGACAAGILQIEPGEKAGTADRPLMEKVFGEIAGLVRPNLKQPDIMSLLPADQAILFLFPGIDREAAAAVIKDLQTSINQLLKDNLPGQKIGLATKTADVKAESTAQEILHSLLGKKP